MSATNTSTPARQLLRVLALVGVFIAAGVLFWKHYENSLNSIQSRQNMWDETETLNKSEKQAVYDFAGRIRKDFGLELNIRITRKEISVPRLDKKTIFIGLCPPRQEAVIVFPPLVRQAVGKEFIEHLENEHFRSYWPNRWPQGLKEALVLMAERLDSAGS
ncbi:MAG: hypothetical protein ACLFSY_07620 [Desulfonatronovibrionaceae bacterium]